MHPIDVAVYDEQEIFRRGVVACLGADSLLHVVADSSSRQPIDADVAVVSVEVATTTRLGCALVVCGGADALDPSFAPNDEVFAILARNRVSPDQLVSAVRAAAVGLHVQPPARLSGVLDQRSVEVLQLLADGAATKEISARMGYSERTIKGIIRDIHVGLGARSRAHAVATALREHLI
ncbi:MAG TPA: LuxR C-terminal-related transcriptional regulator [Acidimicrobiales bacterium]|nr:LuxR C-terminal-related transcriptional regulator [Acidimicrobiales bacterium]